jgi:hypothetical protein
MENVLFKLANSITSFVHSYAKTNSSLNIFPNPITVKIKIKTENFFKNVTLDIYNLHGRQVKQINRVHSKSQKCGGCKEQTLTMYI